MFTPKIAMFTPVYPEVFLWNFKQLKKE